MIVHGRRGRGRRGATIVESAFVLTLFLFLVFGIFEFGRVLMVRHLLDNAAWNGARLAVAGTNTQSTANITSSVTNTVVGQQLSNVNVQVYLTDTNGNNLGANWSSAAFGNLIAVEITADYRPMLPTYGILSSKITMKARTIMRSEGG
jgi:Flp pilus assembly protein TadG